MMNWSAKDGARSSPHYGGEGVSIHPSHQGVCRRHGTEEPHVTPGDLARSSVGTEVSRPISQRAKWMKPSQPTRVRRKRLWQNLQRHLAVQLAIGGLIDLAHPTLADEGGHLEGPECAADF